MRKNHFLNVKNSLLELEKGFIEQRYIELKEREREVKIKREIQEPFLKPIIVSIDDMDKLDKKEMKKIGPFKNTWFD